MLATVERSRCALKVTVVAPTSSIGFVPEMRARGYATRAVNLVTAWAFSELGIARVQLWTEPDNLASQRVAVASGFTREGVLRHYDEIDGQRVDSVFFSRLPGDTSATLSQHPMSTAYLTVLKPLVWARAGRTMGEWRYGTRGGADGVAASTGGSDYQPWVWPSELLYGRLSEDLAGCLS